MHQRAFNVGNILPILFCALAGLYAGGAWSQAYPTRPVTIVVPVAAGGGADFLMRTLAAPLSERLGQPFLVENRAGANGDIAHAFVAKAQADGHTLMMLLPTLTTNQAMAELGHGTSPYKISDFTPISRLVDYYFAIPAHPDFPANSFTEFVNLVKSKPGTVRFGNSGGSVRLMAALIAEQLGYRGMELDIPFKGAGDARPAVVAHTVDYTWDTPAGPQALVAAGRLKVIFVTGPKRMAIFPNAQALGEAVPGLEVKSWLALGGPAGIPKDRVDRIRREVVATMKTPDMQKKMDAVFYEVVASTPEELGATMQADLERLKRAIRLVGPGQQ